ncbi:hypothetical protein CVU75_00355 [Candidatus Dependentiae bacterium HGW-Dependentiae-1]|nr:MAG: hypothetical protein CVU75_00355 [Candidatus Dependentiae bacterium HGW-Dependentiae-1]
MLILKKIIRQSTVLAPLIFIFFCPRTPAQQETPQATVSAPTNVTANSEQKQTNTPQKTVKAEKKEKKKHGGRCRSKKHASTKQKKAAKKTIKDMSYEELKELKGRLVAQKKNDAAIKCLEKMVAQCKDIVELKTCMIELADLLFDSGKLIQAEKMYTEFAKLYPGSDKIETVLYKAILCAYYSILDAQHDQTKTHDALELANQFLEREELFPTYAGQVKKIKQQCHAKLFESEENIVNFYFKRNTKKDLIAAENRIKDMHKDYITILPEAESRVLALECSLAEKQHDPVMALHKREELAIALSKLGTQASDMTIAALEKPQNFSNRF